MSGTRNLEGLKMQALTCIEAAYDKGYKSGLKDGNINDGTFAAKIKEAYNNGLSDAEKAVRRLIDSKDDGGLSAGEMMTIFGMAQDYVILTNFSMSEIVKKIREYDKQKEVEKASDDEICVGDEVMFMNQKYIVIKLMKYADSAIIINQKDVLAGLKKNFKKTGRNYPVVEMLEGLKNDFN